MSDLTTLAAVRAFLQKPATETNQDPVISDLITRASVAILRWTGREFAPVTATAARVFVYQGGNFLDLYPYDLRSVSSMILDSDLASTITLTSGTDYQLRPLPARDGVYQYLRLPTYSAWLHDGVSISHVKPERQITITGAWGFASVPADIAHACIVTVATWLRADVQAFSTTINIDEGRLQRPEALPAAVVATLAPYRRRVMLV